MFMVKRLSLESAQYHDRKSIRTNRSGRDVNNSDTTLLEEVHLRSKKHGSIIAWSVCCVKAVTSVRLGVVLVVILCAQDGVSLVLSSAVSNGGSIERDNH